MLDLRDLEFDGMRIAMRGESVDDRSSRITERQQFGDFVESLAGGVVAGVANFDVGPKMFFDFGKVEMRMATRHDKSEHRKLQVGILALSLLEQHGVDVAFEMVDRDQRLAERKRKGFGEADANQQRAR